MGHRHQVSTSGFDRNDRRLFDGVEELGNESKDDLEGNGDVLKISCSASRIPSAAHSSLQDFADWMRRMNRTDDDCERWFAKTNMMLK
jgi:hypothetical protein